MKININKEHFKMIGTQGLKLGKAIVIEGTKALAIKAMATTITTSFDEGMAGVKNLSFDDLVIGKKAAKKDDSSQVKVEIVEILDTDKIAK